MKEVCEDCQQFQVDMKAERTDWGGLCPQFGIGRNADTEACTNTRAKSGTLKS